MKDSTGQADAAGIRIGQFHPEYGPGQLEISLPAAGPVPAADLNVFARHVIRAHSAAQGWRASFAPTVIPGQVGNGGHLHVSVWRGGRNLLSGARTPTPSPLPTDGVTRARRTDRSHPVYASQA